MLRIIFKKINDDIGAIATLSIFIVCFVIGFSWVSDLEDKQTQVELDRRIQFLKGVVSERLRERINTLDRLAQRFSHNKGKWLLEVEKLYLDYDGFQAIEWANKETSLEWIYPIKGNESAIGLVLNKETKRKNAIEISIKQKKSFFTDPISLKQGGLGFLSIHPTFKNKIYSGLIVGVYRAKDIFKKIVGNDFKVSIYFGDKEVFSNNIEQDFDIVKSKTFSMLLSGQDISFKINEINKFQDGDFSDKELYVYFSFTLFFVFTLFFYIDHGRRKKIIKSNDENIKVSNDLEHVLESSGLGVWDWDLESNIVLVDKRWLLMLGLNTKKTTLSLRSWEDLIHPDDLDRSRLEKERYLSGERDKYESYKRIKHKDGHWLHISSRGRISKRDENGRPIRFMGTYFDISKVTEQERRIKELFTLLDDTSIISETDQEGRITGANKKFCKISKFSENELIGKNHRIINSQYHDKSFFTEMWRTIQNGEIWRGEVKNKAKDGSFYWVFSSIYPKKNDDNKVVKYTSIRYDITDRKLNEEIRLEEKKYLLYKEKINDIVSDLLLEKNKMETVEALYLEVLDKLCLAFGWDIGHVYLVNSENENELVSSGIWSSKDLDKYKDFIELTEETHFNIGEGLPGKIYKTKEISLIQNVQLDKNYLRNEKITNLGIKTALGIPIIEGGEKVISIIELYSDEERLKEDSFLRAFSEKVDFIGNLIGQFLYEDELKISKDKAEDSEKAKTQFLANMSHEIRTPMNGIIGMVSVLKDTSLNNEQKGIINILNSSCDTLLSLLNDILDISKIESGNLDVELVDFDLKKLIKDIDSLFIFSIKDKGLNFEIKIDKSINNKYVGDVTKIRQILLNLLTNAIKFTDKGSIKMNVTSSDLTENEKLVTISIEDSGIGIAMDKIDNLFKSFSQADNSMTRKYGGTGLGLNISSELAGMMKGSISLDTTEGKGSTFTLRLPLTSVENDNNLIEIDEDSMAIDYSVLKVLIVEDNLINQKVATLTLKKLGISCEIASNGQEAVEACLKISYDFVFMDLQMPVLDGIEATKIIVDRLGLDAPQIIAMTANAYAQDRIKCNEAGMVGFIPKPIKDSLIKETIDNLSQLKKAS